MPGVVVPLNVLIFKAMLRNEAHRFALAEQSVCLEGVKEMVRYFFELARHQRFNMYCVNADGEMIYVKSELEFADACKNAKVKSDLERELVLVVDPDTAPEAEDSALTRFFERMQQLEVDLHRRIDEINASLDVEDISLPSAPHKLLPHWVAREGMDYETVRAESPSQLSNINNSEDEADLLSSPGLTVEALSNNGTCSLFLPQIDVHSSFRSALADYVRCAFGYDNLPSPGEVIYEGDFEPYEDDEESEEFNSAPQTALACRFASDALSLPVKRVRFQVPFPGFVPFPPSPTGSSPVFSLSEATPFPFPATVNSAASCTCRCTCSSVPAQVSVGTDAVVTTRPFKFVVSVGTQCTVLSPQGESDFVPAPTRTANCDAGVGTDTVVLCSVGVHAVAESAMGISVETQYAPMDSAVNVIARSDAATQSETFQTVVEDAIPEEICVQGETDQAHESEDADSEYEMVE